MDKQEEKNTQQLVFFSYIDKETGKVLAQDQAAGKTGELINYQPDQRLAALEQQGYELAYNGFPEGTRYSDNSQMNQVFAILLQHKRRVVTPAEAAEQGIASGNDAARSYSLTVSFVDEQGTELHSAESQQATWRRPFTLDEVTKKVVVKNDGEWLPDKKEYGVVKAPVIAGYLAEKAELSGQPVAQQNLNSTIVYHPLGKIIPVTANGQPIPNVEPVQYQNDPNDASKVVAQALPQITGYMNNLQSLTPINPLKDTKILYEVASTPATPNVGTKSELIDDKQEVHHYTVHFLNQEGEKLAADNVQDSIWHSDGSRNIKNYQNVNAPVINGYYTIDHRVKGPVVVPFELNHTVIYRRLGKIIPIDQNGVEIAGAPHPTYQNDPADPTSPLADQPVPQIAGYTAEVATITPDDGDINTKVIYRQN
jgi:hypothetical protein